MTISVCKDKLYYKNKERAYNALGNKCNQCGFADTRALQIDHILSDGVKDRIPNKRSYYSRVARSVEAAEGRYQLLCANCNWIKRHTHNEK